jgi:hypothetical protein
MLLLLLRSWHHMITNGGEVALGRRERRWDSALLLLLLMLMLMLMLLMLMLLMLMLLMLMLLLLLRSWHHIITNGGEVALGRRER